MTDESEKAAAVGGKRISSVTGPSLSREALNASSAALPRPGSTHLCERNRSAQTRGPVGTPAPEEVPPAAPTDGDGPDEARRLPSLPVAAPNPGNVASCLRRRRQRPKGKSRLRHRAGAEALKNGELLHAYGTDDVKDLRSPHLTAPGPRPRARAPLAPPRLVTEALERTVFPGTETKGAGVYVEGHPFRSPRSSPHAKNAATLGPRSFGPAPSPSLPHSQWPC